jgi:hypothetical protein
MVFYFDHGSGKSGVQTRGWEKWGTEGNVEETGVQNPRVQHGGQGRMRSPGEAGRKYRCANATDVASTTLANIARTSHRNALLAESQAAYRFWCAFQTTDLDHGGSVLRSHAQTSAGSLRRIGGDVALWLPVAYPSGWQQATFARSPAWVTETG